MIVGSFELLNRYEVIVANYCHVTVNYYNNYAIILLLHDSEVLTRRSSGKITRFSYNINRLASCMVIPSNRCG